MTVDKNSVYSSFNPDAGKLSFLRPSAPRTLRSAACLERDIMLKVREIFPEWHEFLLKGEPKRLVPVNLDNEEAFVDMFVKMRRTNALAQYHDVDSISYTPESVPNLFTCMTSFWMPHPKKPLKPYENKEIAWNSSFNLGGRAGYERVEIIPTLAIETRPYGMQNIRSLFEYCIERFDPSNGGFWNTTFREIAWRVEPNISFLNYFSHTPLVDFLKNDSRAEAFHKGIILQLSPDPLDMSNETFIHSCQDFINSLAPYWPKKVE
jgi:hypothetical protein